MAYYLIPAITSCRLRLFIAKNFPPQKLAELQLLSLMFKVLTHLFTHLPELHSKKTTKIVIERGHRIELHLLTWDGERAYPWANPRGPLH